jgi:hypothetical protein
MANFINEKVWQWALHHPLICQKIYLQYIESNYTINTITKHNTQGYFRYVDDILIIYDSTNTDI